jgi:hypothetical protein
MSPSTEVARARRTVAASLDPEPICSIASVEQLEPLRSAAVAREALDELLDGVAVRLFVPLDRVGSDLDELGIEGDEDLGGPEGGYRAWIAADPPEGIWISRLRDASVFVMIASDRGAGGGLVPFAYAGFSWVPRRSERRRLDRPTWSSALKRAGFQLRWEDEEACIVVAGQPLITVCSCTVTIEHHIDALGAWAQQQLHAALTLPSPS